MRCPASFVKRAHADCRRAQFGRHHQPFAARGAGIAALQLRRRTADMLPHQIAVGLKPAIGNYDGGGGKGLRSAVRLRFDAGNHAVLLEDAAGADAPAQFAALRCQTVLQRLHQAMGAAALPVEAGAHFAQRGEHRHVVGAAGVVLECRAMVFQPFDRQRRPAGDGLGEVGARRTVGFFLDHIVEHRRIGARRRKGDM